MERGKFSGFDHVDARVRDLTAARMLYDALMPALGLTHIYEEEGQVEYYHPPLVVNAPLASTWGSPLLPRTKGLGSAPLVSGTAA